MATMGLRPDWPNLGAISLAHSYGFSNLVLPLLLHGIPLFLVPSPLPEVLRSSAPDQPDLTLAGVPALWHAWHEARAIPRNVRLAISASAPLPLALEQAVFEAHGLKIHNFYGSSECGGIAYDATAVPRTDDACVGRPMQNVDLALDPDGMLVVRSSAVAETYWPTPSDNLGHGRFQTSDLAELQAGTVYLWRAERECRSRGPHRGVCGRQTARHSRGIKTVPAPKTAGLAGAARVVVREVTGCQHAREGFPRGVAEQISQAARAGKHQKLVI